MKLASENTWFACLSSDRAMWKELSKTISICSPLSQGLFHWPVAPSRANKACIHCFGFPKTEMKDVWSQSWIMFVNVSYTWIHSSGMSCKASNPNSAHYTLEAMTTPWCSVRFLCRKFEPETCFLCCGHLDLLALDWLPLDGSGADDR